MIKHYYFVDNETKRVLMFDSTSEYANNFESIYIYNNLYYPVSVKVQSFTNYELIFVYVSDLPF